MLGRKIGSRILDMISARLDLSNLGPHPRRNYDSEGAATRDGGAREHHIGLVLRVTF